MSSKLTKISIMIEIGSCILDHGRQAFSATEDLTSKRGLVTSLNIWVMSTSVP